MFLNTQEKVIELIARKAKMYDMDIHVNFLNGSDDTGHILFVRDLTIEFAMAFVIRKENDFFGLSLTKADENGEHFKNKSLGNYELAISSYHFDKKQIQDMLESVEAIFKEHTKTSKSNVGFL